jgi:hypothetical protein
MAFIRRKGKGYALVETYREGGKVRQRVLAYLRGSPTLAEAASAAVMSCQGRSAAKKASRRLATIP